MFPNRDFAPPQNLIFFFWHARNSEYSQTFHRSRLLHCGWTGLPVRVRRHLTLVAGIRNSRAHGCLMDTPLSLPRAGGGLEDESRPGVSLGSRHRDCTMYLSAMRNLVFCVPLFALGLLGTWSQNSIPIILSRGVLRLGSPFSPMVRLWLYCSLPRCWFKNTTNAGSRHSSTSCFRCRSPQILPYQVCLRLFASSHRRSNSQLLQRGSTSRHASGSPFQQI